MEDFERYKLQWMVIRAFVLEQVLEAQSFLVHKKKNVYSDEIYFESYFVFMLPPNFWRVCLYLWNILLRHDISN
jgi:hypothetical protein